MKDPWTVMWKVGADLLFKFICYMIVYKFYVYVKPKFCRKPVLPESEWEMLKTIEAMQKLEEENSKESDNCDDDGSDTEKPCEAKDNKLDDLEPESIFDEEDDDKFCEAAEKIIATLKSRKSYQSSKVVQELHALYKKDAESFTTKQRPSPEAVSRL